MTISFRATLGLLLLLAVVAAGPGCRTTPKINWDARVGAYSYDQAVAELGPPNEETTLSDGVRVAQWITGRVGNTTAFPVGGAWGPYGGFYAPGPVVVSSSITQYYLRLTFGPDGQLQAWKKGAQ
jgi:hypothetical protein